MKILFLFVLLSGSLCGFASENVSYNYFANLSFSPVIPPDADGKGVFISPIFGDMKKQEPIAFLMKFSAGRSPISHSHSNDYYGVVIKGNYRHYLKDKNESKVMTTGDQWFQKGGVFHEDFCEGPEDCYIHIYYPKGWDVKFPTSMPVKK